jgi:glutamine cyclotransferase
MAGQKIGTEGRIGVIGALVLVLALLAGCGAPPAQTQPTAADAAGITATKTDTATAPAGVDTATAAALPPEAHPTKLAAVQLYTYHVLDAHPHDPAAFTQGLIVRGGEFIEGTGLEGQSTLRRVAIETGEVLQRHALGAEYFGEGITELNGKIYQLTWRNQTGFIYDAETLAPEGQFTYATEGWGITHDGERLIVSDGTPVLQFWDPETLQPTGSIAVNLFGLPLPNLNELEYIDGDIYANIWQTNLVVRIDPASGNVTGVIDLAGLLDYAPAAHAKAAAEAQISPDVLNGIAYDEATERLYVTGKRWPTVFAIQLLEVKP